MPELAFQAQIYNYVEEAPNKITFPDKTNRGKMLAMLMLWKRMGTLAEKKYESLLKQLVDEDLIKDPKSMSIPGQYRIGEANAITVELTVSKPRREFNMDWFANEMKRQFKVPESVTKELYEKAKQEGKSQTRTVSVKEKGIDI